MNLELSDLDSTVSRDRAAELLRVSPIYVQQLCKKGEIRGEMVAGQGPQRKKWTNIATMDLIMLAALRHNGHTRGGTHVATPEEIVAALPHRCPRCDILSDGLCEACRRDLDGAPYWERRE